MGGPSIQDAAAVVDKIVTGQNGQRPLAELPIHLMGHSRGGGLVAELARQLGEHGVVVDQLTLLDPHPLTTSDPQPSPPATPVIDTPLGVYNNVVFADNYWQNTEYPQGTAVSGAYHRLWGQMTGGYYNNTPPAQYRNHRNINLMYQGTVNLSNPVNNGEAVMDATERAAWFNTYDAGGANNGSSWTDAYTSLQSALADAGCIEIWVAAGTYKPGTSGARTSTFQLKNGVALYGGFDGTEGSRDARKAIIVWRRQK